MFQEMLQGSRAVLFSPSEATFREQSRNNLAWAFGYVAAAALIVGILGALLAPLQRASIDQALDQAFAQQGIDPAEFEAQTGIDIEQFTGLLTGLTNPVAALINGLVSGVLGFLLASGILFLLARMLGGVGEYGRFAYALALFNAPISVVNAVVALVPLVGALASLGLWVYSLILTYQSLRGTLELTGGKATVLAMLPFLMIIALGLCFCVAIFGLIATLGANA